MKPFVFQKFQISQSKNVFRVGTDGVLLGALASVKNSEKVLEVGTGTGLVSLMLAQRNPNAKILALDISEEAAQLSGNNFRESVFNSRISAIHQDFKNFETEEKFDFIVSNPPYFEENNSEKDKIARQKTELNFSELIQKSSELISENGAFSVIIPSDSTEFFISESLRFQLKLVRKINVFGILGGTLRRNILEFSKTDFPLEIIDFNIEKSPRNYSDQYLELTKDFHIFKKPSEN